MSITEKLAQTYLLQNAYYNNMYGYPQMYGSEQQPGYYFHPQRSYEQEKLNYYQRNPVTR
jgi:hypothetical protein